MGFPAFPASQLFHLRSHNCIAQQLRTWWQNDVKIMQNGLNSITLPPVFTQRTCWTLPSCIPARKSWKKQGLHPTLSLSLALHSQLCMGRAGFALAGSSMSSQLPADPNSQRLRDPHTDNTGSHTHRLFLLTLRLSSNSFYLLSLTLKGYFQLIFT